MSLEIDILNGDASWGRTEPLHDAVFGREIVEFPGGHVGYAQAPAEFAEVLVRVLDR